MSNNKNREFVRTLHSMIADFLRDNPDIDRSYYQEIWDWLEKKEGEETEDERMVRILKEGLKGLTVFNYTPVDEILAWLEKQKEPSMSAEEVLIKAGLKPYKDGNKWCILAGDNIQEGICGFGDTIDEALYQFLMEVCDKQKEQKPAEWSEGDSVILNEIIDFFENGTVRLQHDLSMYAQWLKSLRPQPKHEWSEEEKKTISFVIDVLRANHPDGFFKTSPAGDIHVTGITVEKLIKKLESLLSRPKPSGNWKPSKYLLSLVKKVADGEMLTGVEQMAMGTLHEGLKKLSI